jgi:hypothetical protein
MLFPHDAENSFIDTSPNLALPYLLANQAQKHVTVNEALRRLDALVQLSVLSANLTAPPTSPADGDRYIVPAGATGAWAGADTSLAAWQDGVWEIYPAAVGWSAWVADEHRMAVFASGIWSATGGSTTPLLVINATADETNRLNINTPSVGFSAETDDIKLTLNKASGTDDARIAFQTAFSARALIGLLGDDAFTIKVSPDGTSYVSAMIVDPSTGHISIGHPPVSDMLEIRGGMFCGYSNDGTNSSAHTNAGIKLYSDNAPYFAATHPYRGTTSSRTGLSFHVAGASVPSEAMRVTYNGLIVGTPAGGEKGPGTINAQAIYDDNALLSCYVFDQVIDGVIDTAKWDGRAAGPRRPGKLPDDADAVAVSAPAAPRHTPMRQFRARIGSAYDPLTLDGYARHWQEKRHLTSMPNEEGFDPATGLSAGEWIQRLIETVEIHAVLIEQLNQKCGN